MMSRLVPVLAFGLLYASGALTSILPSEEHSHRAAGLEAHESHASASLLGQCRTSFASWLWLRTDLYMHNGVEMRPLSDAEQLQGVTSEGAAQGEISIGNEDSVTTVIPPAERDFRGVFGEIERATSAYKVMTAHHHNQPEATLPLFRLMTWIDPQFIPGWTTGAAILTSVDTRARTSQAIGLLQEGLAENPESVEIWEELARIQINRQHDKALAIRTLETARRFHTSVDLGDEQERESLLNVYRWLCLCYRDTSAFSRMTQAAEEGLKTFPDDAVLQRMTVKAPLVLSPENRRRWYIERAGQSNGAFLSSTDSASKS